MPQLRPSDSGLSCATSHHCRHHLFVMSHHPHPTIDFPDGTSFRFVDGPPDEVLRLAREAAGASMSASAEDPRPASSSRPAWSTLCTW